MRIDIDKVPRADKLKHCVYTFDCYSELINFAETRKAFGYGNNESHSRNPRFYGHESFTKALELARYGWPEGRKKIEELTVQINDKVMSLIERPELVYGVTGNNFDVGLMLSGAPEHWYTIENTVVEGTSNKIIKMVFNIGARATVSTETFEQRGAVAAALVEALEYGGFRVELWMACHARMSFGDDYCHDIAVCIKPADQPLDMDRLAFALVHPASHRRMIFAVREHCEQTNGAIGGSNPLPEDQQGDIYIDRADGSYTEWSTPEASAQWILKTLKEKGVAINE